MERAPIIVGLDGSPASMEAVRWAAWQSQETSTPLHVLHAYPSEVAPADQEKEFRSVHESWQRSRASRWLRDALDESAALPFRLRLVVAEGTLEQVLADRVCPDGLLVLGAPTAESIPAWCLGRVGCPVVLVPVRASLVPEQPVAEHDTVGTRLTEALA